MEYTAKSESPESYHRWCAMSIIASAVRRQVWIDMGFFRVYPNMYIVLVGPPGRCRKSVAINTATNLIQGLSDIRVSADAITREALIRAIKLSETQTEIGNKIYMHSSITIISKELSVFLGTNNSDLLSLLTDLYDNPDMWEYRTKNSGIDTITNVWLNKLAASTPAWLVGSVPLSAIGGGYTSRVIFVVEHDVRHKIAIPTLSKNEQILKHNLIADLEDISLTRGEFNLTSGAKEMYEKWYMDQGESIEQDARFWGYYERRHIHLLKIATIVAISSNSQGIVDEEHLIRATNYLYSIEPNMKEAFGAAGRSENAADIDQIIKIIQTMGSIDKQDLIGLTWRDISTDNFEKALMTLYKMGAIDQSIQNGKIKISIRGAGDEMFKMP